MPGGLSCRCTAQVTKLMPSCPEGRRPTPPACTAPQLLLPGAPGKTPAQGSSGLYPQRRPHRAAHRWREVGRDGGTVPGAAPGRQAHRDLAGHSGAGSPASARHPQAALPPAPPRPAEGLCR